MTFSAKNQSRQFSFWRRIEVFFYITFIALLFFLLLPEFASFVREQCSSAYDCARHLRQGWFSSYQVDDADNQWRVFRNGLPILGVVAGIKISLTFLLSFKQNNAGLWRSVFEAVFSLAFLWVLHGPGCIIPVVLLLSSSQISQFCGSSRAGPIGTWIFALLLLYIKDLHPSRLSFAGIFGEQYSYLDNQGIYPWRFALPLTILRLISFNLDFYWSCCNADKKKKIQPANIKQSSLKDIKSSHTEQIYKAQVKGVRPLKDYSLLSCFSYLFYAPLYLAGPILPFNSFISQIKEPQKMLSRRYVCFYLVRVVLAVALMEAFMCYLPIFAVLKSSLFMSFPPWRIVEFMYMMINVMWLKFLCIWRFDRAWALLDGIYVPENMTRCMNNNYSLTMFWRGWHSSYNQWLVRYMYIPLGGRDWKYLNCWVIFLFVAIWHDLELNVLIWGILNGGFVALEVFVQELYTAKKDMPLVKSNYFRYLASTIIGMYLIILILSNLIGYSVGVHGTSHLVNELFIKREGLLVLLIGTFLLSCAIQLMFAIEDIKNLFRKAD